MSKRQIGKKVAGWDRAKELYDTLGDERFGKLLNVFGEIADSMGGVNRLERDELEMGVSAWQDMFGDLKPSELDVVEELIEFLSEG